MTARVKVKPPYVGLLNAIAVGENRGGQLFEAWASTTANPKLRECLSVVARREYDHGELFCNRLAELGFELIEKPDPSFDQRLSVLRSDASDAEKLATFEGPRRSGGNGSAPAAPAPAPPQMDAVTKALFDWYLAEEADSGRLLREAFAEIRQGADGKGKKKKKAKAAEAASAEDDCVRVFKAIAAGEKVGGQVLSAWAGATTDPELRETLALVAARETEHARVFRARLEELGIEVEERSGEKLDGVIAFYASDAPDCEKVERSAPSIEDTGGLDQLEQRAKSFGTVEQHLVTWFVGEERDSTARLRKAYAAVMAAAGT